jgi:outer membrane protein with beta-barrel domain
MKKAVLAIVFALFAFAASEAQVTFKPGIRAGVNFSHFTQDDDLFNIDEDDVDSEEEIDFSAKTDFYIGFIGELKLTKYYTLQPEITYTRQGTKYDAGAGDKDQIDLAYLSIGITNKFTFNKFNVHVGPTIDFMVEKSGIDDPDSDVDLAFVGGIGYNITNNLGIELRAKRGIVPVIDSSTTDHSNVVFSIGAYYTFDVKTQK